MPRVELGGALADSVSGPSGVEQVIVLVKVEVFAQQRETQLTGEASGFVPEPTGSRRSGAGSRSESSTAAVSSESCVQDLVVEVVATDRRPDIVDDAQLGMDVNGTALHVLDIEHLNPVPARLPHHGQGLGVSQHR